jgi:hypothetical protein
VSWDSNWPSPRPRLRGRIPASARAEDVLAGGGGAGSRIAIRVVEDDGGMLTGEEVSDSWRDPPFEDGSAQAERHEDVTTGCCRWISS